MCKVIERNKADETPNEDLGKGRGKEAKRSDDSRALVWFQSKTEHNTTPCVF